jgi:probable F420-dependent oxidoreductase
MDIGVCLPNCYGEASAAAIERAARRAEELGFASVWVTDHIVAPEEFVPRFGKIIFEPVVTVAYVAGATSRVKLGTSVIIAPYRNPVVLAKMMATLDQLSRGRIIFGLAAGWMEREFEILQVPFRKRGRLTDEAIRVAKAMWSEPVPVVEGEFYRFKGAYTLPHPAGALPIWVGGNSLAARRRAVTLAEGWQSTGLTVEAMRKSIQELRELAAALNRSLDGFTISMRHRVRFVEPRVDEFQSSEEEVLDSLRRAAEAGVHHFVADVQIWDEKAYFEDLERLAALVDRL